MELTAAQKQTLEDFEKSEETKRIRFKVVGSDRRTGSLLVRAEETFALLPNGLTSERPVAA